MAMRIPIGPIIPVAVERAVAVKLVTIPIIIPAVTVRGRITIAIAIIAIIPVIIAIIPVIIVGAVSLGECSDAKESYCKKQCNDLFHRLNF